MGLLNRLFGQKQPDAPSERLNESIATMEKYLRGITSHYGDVHFQGDTQAKQILSVYSFGGISALAIQHKLTPPQAHAASHCSQHFLGTTPLTPQRKHTP